MPTYPCNARMQGTIGWVFDVALLASLFILGSGHATRLVSGWYAGGVLCCVVVGVVSHCCTCVLMLLQCVVVIGHADDLCLLVLCFWVWFVSACCYGTLSLAWVAGVMYMCLWCYGVWWSASLVTVFFVPCCFLVRLICQCCMLLHTLVQCAVVSLVRRRFGCVFCVVLAKVNRFVMRSVPTRHIF